MFTTIDKPIDRVIKGVDVNRYIMFKDNKTNTWDNNLFFKFYDRFTPYGKELLDRIYKLYKCKKLKIKKDVNYTYDLIKDIR